LFAAGAVALGALAGAALFAAAIYAVQPPVTADAIAYYGLLKTVGGGKSGTVVPWPEHPGLRFVYDGPSPNYRRPWAVPDAKPAGIPRRVLMLGDSHLQGVCDTRDNMTAVLCDELSPTQVVNCGVFGWSPLDALRYYRDELKGKQFDTVVLVLYLGNDIAEMVKPGMVQLVRGADGAWREEETVATAAPSRVRLGLDRLGFGGATAAERRALDARMFCATSPGAIDQGFLQARFFQDEPQRLPQALDALREVLSRLRDTAKQRGADFRLVLLPTKNMVEPDTIADIRALGREQLGLTSESLGLDEHLRAEAGAIGADLGIPVKDLTPALRAARQRDPSAPLYWRADFHLGYAGHRAAAQALRETLAR
jgi:hypothetical protein